MTHLTPELIQSTAAGRRTATGQEAQHIELCAACRGALADRQTLIVAARTVDRDRVGAVAAPAFSTLLPKQMLAAVRPIARQRSVVLAPVVGSPTSSWSLSGQLVRAQLTMFTPLVTALAVGISFAALGAALGIDQNNYGAMLGASALGLLLVGAGLLASEPRRNLRNELFEALPIAPRVVYLFRLSTSLAVGLSLALTVTIIQVVVMGTASMFISTALSWLVPGLLASSCAASVSVRWGQTAGQVTGLAMWVGITALRTPTLSTGGGFGHSALGTALVSPLLLVVAAVMFGAAALSMPGRRTSLGVA